MVFYEIIHLLKILLFQYTVQPTLTTCNEGENIMLLMYIIILLQNFLTAGHSLYKQALFKILHYRGEVARHNKALLPAYQL